MNLGEILKIAALDTAIGMGMVFIILILIAFIIYLLGVIAGTGENKNKAPNVAILHAGQDAEATEDGLEPDGELSPALAAVIAMTAIKEYMKEHSAEDEYIVRRVRRSTWKHTS